VKIVFDPAKSARSAKERGLPFELTAEVDWSVARSAGRAARADDQDLHARLLIASCRDDTERQDFGKKLILVPLDPEMHLRLRHRALD